jgi:hypothetical protein
MFKRHATFRRPEFGIAKFRLPVPWRALSLGPKAAHAKAAHAKAAHAKAAHANDNLWGPRRLAGKDRPLPPRLTCLWVRTDGNRLECRWRIENPDGIGADEVDGVAARAGPRDRQRAAGFHMTVFKLSYQERNGLSSAEHGGIRAAGSIRKSSRNSP